LACLGFFFFLLVTDVFPTRALLLTIGFLLDFEPSFFFAGTLCVSPVALAEALAEALATDGPCGEIYSEHIHCAC